MHLMKIIYITLIGLFCTSCTIVSYNRTFPKPTWYWSKAAKEQRDERQFYKQQDGEFDNYDKTNNYEK